MYNLDIILKLREEKISINKYITLKIIEDCSLSLFKDEYKLEVINLKLEGLVNEKLELTTKAVELLQNIENKTKKITNYTDIHKMLQDKLVELTGKKQYMVEGKYAFLNNLTDFNNKLKQTIVKYKLKDIEIVKNLLISHIKKSVEAKFKYTTLIGYYISKEGKSSLATDYDNYDDSVKEEITTKLNTFDGINI